MRWFDANLCSPINSRRLCDHLWHYIAIIHIRKFCSAVCVGTRFPVLNKILLFHGSGPIGMNFLHVFSIELQFHLVFGFIFSLSLSFIWNSVWITDSYSPTIHATPPHTMAHARIFIVNKQFPFFSCYIYLNECLCLRSIWFSISCGVYLNGVQCVYIQTEKYLFQRYSKKKKQKNQRQVQPSWIRK